MLSDFTRSDLPSVEKEARTQEEIDQLRQRWTKYNFPTQEALEQILKRFGPDAARWAVTAVDLSQIGQ
jgi:hypothetical protein